MNSLEKWTFKYWWVIVFSLSASCLLEFNLLRLKIETEVFQAKYSQLKNTHEQYLKESLRLKQELYSLNDPDFVTLVLMRTFGVVPEGQTKVSFQ